MTHIHESMERTIDDVARAMTEAPSRALRARVVAGLRPRPSRRASWLAPAAVILATASVAFVVVIRSRPVTVRPPTVISAPIPLRSVATLVAPPQRHGAEASGPAVRRVDATANARSAAESSGERAVPELPTIDDLAISPIQPTALPIAQLEVAPIAPAEPLVVKTIGSDR